MVRYLPLYPDPHPVPNYWIDMLSTFLYLTLIYFVTGN